MYQLFPYAAICNSVTRAPGILFGTRGTSNPCSGASGGLRWLQAAACFQGAADTEPANLKALGNWGNALLEHGKVRPFPQADTLSVSRLCCSF